MATLSRIETFVFRAPVAEPVRTSFGIMADRVAVLVRVEDSDGAFGWGEIWSNFPSVSAEHRARLVDGIVAPLLLGRPLGDPVEVWRGLTRRLHVLAIQAGEPGPLAAGVAGLDIALWDLAARRAGQPLWQALGGASSDPLPAYASGLNPGGAAETVARARGAGYRAFKLKIGFGADADLSNLRAITAALRPGERFMVDVNQGWDLATASDMARRMADVPLFWIEEPLPADRPADEWRALAAVAAAPLAGGENLRDADFRQAIEGSWLGVIQPDICKWGGLSGCRPVAQAAIAAGRLYCPHFLGSGIGLIASAHLLAAVGGDGLLELDFNPNPLRAALAQPFPTLADGRLPLPAGPGLGVEPDLATAKDWLTHHAETRASVSAA